MIARRMPLLLALLASLIVPAMADDPAKPGEASEKAEAPPVPLNKAGTVLLDKADGRLLLKAKVALERGTLEMLLCKKQTKEHESILAIDADAVTIHTGLLALGAETGSTVRYVDGKFIPPTGTEVKIFLTWKDKDGKPHREPAQQWIRHAIHRFYTAEMEKLPDGLKLPEGSELRYDEKLKELYWYGPMSAAERDRLLKLSNDKTYQAAVRRFHELSQSRPMEAKWVFAGSGFFVPDEGPERGKRFYKAEGGDVICVANFPTAMLDIAEESSASGAENLLYEAWTERIPPLETEVTVELIPVLKEEKEEAK
jgi:hypothetical protein